MALGLPPAPPPEKPSSRDGTFFFGSAGVTGGSFEGVGLFGSILVELPLAPLVPAGDAKEASRTARWGAPFLAMQLVAVRGWRARGRQIEREQGQVVLIRHPIGPRLPIPELPRTFVEYHLSRCREAGVSRFRLVRGDRLWRRAAVSLSTVIS